MPVAGEGRAGEEARVLVVWVIRRCLALSKCANVVEGELGETRHADVQGQLNDSDSIRCRLAGPCWGMLDTGCDTAVVGRWGEVKRIKNV
jgi:hypothetical protein